MNCKMMKKLQLFFILFVLLSTVTLNVDAETVNSANLTNVSYAYDLSGKPYIIPSPYVHSRSIDAGYIGIDDFKDVSDIFYDINHDLIVISDSGNDRILILNGDYTLITELKSFVTNGTNTAFNCPKSAVIRGNTLYVADTFNSRILCFDIDTWMVSSEFATPEVSALGKDYIYHPMKIAVDDAKHIYVIAENITDGIILLDSDGKFLSFFGAPKVQVSAFENMKKRFMTKEQRSKLYKSIPTEYSAITVDSTGFIGLTTQSSNADPISRMNHAGVNIFSKKMNIPKGDEVYSLVASSFVDLTEDAAGNYLALDNRRGRIFIYNKEGDFLGCFGGPGTQNGTFYSATSIEFVHGEIAVVDISRNIIELFKPTHFGETIFTGFAKINSGDYIAAKPYFEKSVEMCSAYLPAHLNLGRIAYWEGNYQVAAEKFKYVDNREYYSLAYKQIRSSFINEKFILIIAVAVIVIAAMLLLTILKKRHSKHNALLKGYVEDFSGFGEKWKYVNYCCFHPFDGYWCVRRENKGSLAVANTLFGLFVLISLIRTQFSGYLFSSIKGENDSIVQTITLLVPILLWVIVNWAISIFFDGKARMKDMYIATCYALKPYIVSSIVLFPLTFILVADEIFVFTILNTMVWIWCVALMFFGMITVQDFSLGKGIVATCFTLLGIALIVFLALVVVNISQDIFQYFEELLSEIRYRFV